MRNPTLLLVDNGSTRPEATKNLRRLAGQLGTRIGTTVHPVSLQHADKIAPELLDGNGAVTFSDFIRNQLRAGNREFLVVPLFFGESRALTSFIPEQVQRLTAECGEFSIRVADVLVPLPEGEPELVKLLRDNIGKATSDQRRPTSHVIMVDHGSPIPEVTAVRKHLASQLRDSLDDNIGFSEAVMERRKGIEFDFNGPLLYDVLADVAKNHSDDISIVLSLLFISPGRHAGPDGDIAQICREVTQTNPHLQISMSPLVGDHPALVDILFSRLEKALLPNIT